MRVAVCQKCKPFGNDENRLLLEEILTAHSAEADLFVFPELFLGGYCSGESLAQFAVAINSELISSLQSLAVKHRVALVVGYVEQNVADAKPFNSAILIDRLGQIAINYQKTHIWGPYEKRFFAPGEALAPVVEIDGFPGVKISLLVCYDVEFPETVRTLALKGANLIIVPTALASDGFNARITIPSRAFENQVFVCYCNRVGAEHCPALDRTLTFCGLSTLVAPSGQELTRADGASQSVLVATVEPSDPVYAECLETNTYFKDRRPELYSL